MPRTVAQRIVDTLNARTSGLLPHDFDVQMEDDINAMAARYEELRSTNGFGNADRTARIEFVERLLGQQENNQCQ